MMMTWLTICTVIFTVLSPLTIAADPCRFQFDGKGTIDLVSLGRTDGTSAFPDKVPASGSNYSMFTFLCFHIYYFMFVNL
jgi:hypothetical protein